MENIYGFTTDKLSRSINYTIDENSNGQYSFTTIIINDYNYNQIVDLKYINSISDFKLNDIQYELFKYLVDEVCLFILCINNDNKISYFYFLNLSNNKYTLIKDKIINDLDTFSRLKNRNIEFDKVEYNEYNTVNLIIDKCMIFGSIKEDINKLMESYLFFINVYINMCNTFKHKYKYDFKNIFVINLFDHPIINKNCDNFIGKCTQIRQSDIWKSSFTVFSSTTSDHFYDKMLPYVDHWEIIHPTWSFYDNNNVNKNRYSISEHITINWHEKTKTLVFRGRNTGCFPNSVEKNSRLNTYYNLLKKYYLSGRYIDYNFDVKIVGTINFNFIDFDENNIILDYTTTNSIKNSLLKYLLKDKDDGIEIIKESMKNYIDTSFNLTDPNFFSMNRRLQSKCKYILNIDGFVTAWRLPYDLSYSSVVVIIENLNDKYKTIFDNLLIDKFNCIKVKSDFSNFNDQMSFLLDNDLQASIIANNGYLLSQLLINEENIFSLFTDQINEDIRKYLNRIN